MKLQFPLKFPTQRKFPQHKTGFTLIELLIVVAIIAILAAIATPNFLEAHVRSKVARVKSDLRSQATAIEAYVVDYNVLPRDSDSDLDQESAISALTLPYSALANGAVQLTTPISYITSLMKDPFSEGSFQTATGGVAIGYRIGSGTWSYATAQSGIADNQHSAQTFASRGKAMAYITFSPGPDKVRARNNYKCFPYRPLDGGASDSKAGLPSFYEDYDPTNGTVSGGDIHRFGGAYLSGDWDRNVSGGGPKGPGS